MVLGWSLSTVFLWISAILWMPPHQVHAGYLSKLDIGTARGGAATKRLAELTNPLICSTILRMSSEGIPDHCQSLGFGFVQFD